MSEPDPVESDEVPSLAFMAATKEPPQTARGARTRAALVAAARVVFERDGFLGSRLTDITAQASCSTGTFYTYFDSKEEIFTAVLEAAQDDMLHPGLPHVEDDDDPIAVIKASNRAYLVAYVRNGQLMKLMQQVATIDPAFQEVRWARALKFAERNARRIAELQARGLADPSLDPLLVSKVLSGMVSRTAMDLLVNSDEYDIDHLTDILTLMWVRALKLEHPKA